MLIDYAVITEVLMLWFAFCFHMVVGFLLAVWEFRWTEPHKFLAITFLGGFLVYAIIIIELGYYLHFKLRKQYDIVR